MTYTTTRTAADVLHCLISDLAWLIEDARANAINATLYCVALNKALTDLAALPGEAV